MSLCLPTVQFRLIPLHFLLSVFALLNYLLLVVLRCFSPSSICVCSPLPPFALISKDAPFAFYLCCVSGLSRFKPPFLPSPPLIIMLHCICIMFAGFQLYSGSTDCTVRSFDLRSRCQVRQLSSASISSPSFNEP